MRLLFFISEISKECQRMMSLGDRIPRLFKLALQWFLVIFLFSFVGSALQSFVPLVVPAIFLVLALFPGKNPLKPRLWKLAPWIWILSGLSALTLLLMGDAMRRSLPPELQKVTLFELCETLVSVPVFLFFYWRQPVGRFLQVLFWLGGFTLISSLVFLVRDWEASTAINDLGQYASELFFWGYLVWVGRRITKGTGLERVTK